MTNIVLNVFIVSPFNAAPAVKRFADAICAVRYRPRNRPARRAALIAAAANAWKQATRQVEAALCGAERNVSTSNPPRGGEPPAAGNRSGQCRNAATPHENRDALRSP
jgi:hypothetical protein